MNAYEEYDAPEGVEVSKRQPAYCPYCGHDGAFDGHGPYGSGYKSRCGECGLAFVTFAPDTAGVGEHE